MSRLEELRAAHGERRFRQYLELAPVLEEEEPQAGPGPHPGDVCFYGTCDVCGEVIGPLWAMPGQVDYAIAEDAPGEYRLVTWCRHITDKTDWKGRRLDCDPHCYFSEVYEVKGWEIPWPPGEEPSGEWQVIGATIPWTVVIGDSKISSRVVTPPGPA